MLYENYETDISKDNLVTVFSKVTSPLCLLGGWAVYLTVNVNYKTDKGRDYHGSKDIDLGFHFSNNETEESLKKSAFNQSIIALEGIGFYSIGFRMIQQYHRETKIALTPEEAKKVRLHDIFSLYVDPMVDNIPKNIHDVLGIIPADEKLLALVFEKGEFIEIEEFGVKIILPKPAVLLATKLISLPKRPIDHKKWKDIADIYALMWYSGTKLGDMKSGVLKLLSQKDIEKAFSKIEDSDYKTASEAIGVGLDEMKNVINSFIATTESKTMSQEKDEVMNDDKWRTPFNIGYDKFTLICKALYQQQADSKPVSVDKLVSLTSLNKSSLGSNMLFLKSVGIVEESESHEYKLTTPLGRDYAKAHFGDDKKLLESTSLQLIENSHLNSLSDKLKINKNMELKDLYSSIKTLGRLSSGSGISGMSPPYATGARTLLLIFKDAGLIPESVDIDISGQHSTPQTKYKKQSTKSPPREKSIEETSTITNETISTLGKLTVQGVGTIDINDDDTLGIAEMYLNLLKKKIQSNKDLESNELDSDE